MRVVHYSTRLGRSGGGLYHSVSGLARAMAGLGAEVIVAGGREARFEEERHVWGDLPLVTHPLGRARYGFSPGMLKQIASLQPDILHIHGIWSAGSIYGRFAKKTQVVVSPRGMLDPWILERRPRVKQLHARFFERPMLERAHLHVLCEHEARSVSAYMPGAQGRIFTLPNGIDRQSVLPDQPRSGALYLGRLHEKKQVLPLIERWERHSNKLKLTIAGWGEAGDETAVAAHCAGKKRVRFAGPLHDGEKDKAFAAAEFFVLPSLSEGLPMAALEALGHGCIPVLTDACHLPELFENDAAIRMEADFSDFGAVLARLEAMSAGEKADRSAASIRAAQSYLWPDIARRMLDHYSAILGGEAA